nr:hypothetical protein [Candidatus Gracilibacteria bacterium]
MSKLESETQIEGNISKDYIKKKLQSLSDNINLLWDNKIGLPDEVIKELMKMLFSVLEKIKNNDKFNQEIYDDIINEFLLNLQKDIRDESNKLDLTQLLDMLSEVILYINVYGEEFYLLIKDDFESFVNYLDVYVKNIVNGETESIQKSVLDTLG